MLAPEERGQLLESGWVVLRGVLTLGEVDGLNAAWDRAAAGPQDRVAEGNWGPRLGEDPAFAGCLRHPRVLAAARVLLGPEIRVTGCHGRSPPLGHGGQGLHVDWPGVLRPDEHRLANAFWVLDGMDASNGATRIVPGSHRWAQVPRGTLAQPHGTHPAERSVEASPGDVLVFSAHLWHAGAQNRSGHRRRLVLMPIERIRGRR